MSRHTVFLINGGAGRVVTSIPALAKYQKLNPDDDFRIVVQGFDQFFWSHPLLQNRTVNSAQRNVFQDVIQHRVVVNPEPYHLHSFYNQQVNLVEAFDEIINSTSHHSDLDQTYLFTTRAEDQYAQNWINMLRQTVGPKPVLVFQPFGSGAHRVNDEVVDISNRSLTQAAYRSMVQKLAPHFLIIYLGPRELRDQHDNISVPFDEHQPYHRTMVALIKNSDTYLGVCSVGQHVARAFGRPGVVMMGGTDERNFSYSDHFHIYRRDTHPRTTYSPWRLVEADNEFSNRDNDGALNLDPTDIQKVCDLIIGKASHIQPTIGVKTVFNSIELQKPMSGDLPESKPKSTAWLYR